MTLALALVLLLLPLSCASNEPTPTSTALPTVPTEQLQEEREVLIALYYALNGDDWESKWLSDTPTGELYGVFTHGNGRVDGLILNNEVEPVIWTRSGPS